MTSLNKIDSKIDLNRTVQTVSNRESLNSIASENSLLSLKNDIVLAKNDFNQYVAESRQSLSKMLRINVSGGEYQERELSLSVGGQSSTVDYGLSRFSKHFDLIGTVVMLLASLTAMLIVLRP